MRSLQARLGTGLVASLIVLFGLQWAVVNLSLRPIAEDYVAAHLDHEIESLLSGLAFDEAGDPRLDPSRVNPVYERPFSGHYYRVAAGDRVLRSRSLWDQDLEVPALQTGETRRLRLSGPEGKPLLVLAGGYTKRGRSATIAVAEDLSLIEGGVRRFQAAYALASIAALAALIAVQYLIVRGGLKPMERIRRDVLRLARGEIGRLSDDVPAEARPLVQEINRLVEIMDQRLQRSRNALGNLAHALKTPLSLLTQLSDEGALRADPALHGRLVQSVSAMRSLMDRELKRARLAGGAPGRRFAPATELPALVEALKAIYRDKSLAFEVRIAPDASFPGDREDLLELSGNLLDNACKWAKSRIRITVEGGPGLALTVEDDGPGCEPDKLALLAERGARIDEATGGHGLGLAIARDIVAGYGGEIRFGRSRDLGGFMAEVRLPPAAREEAR